MAYERKYQVLSSFMDVRKRFIYNRGQAAIGLPNPPLNMREDSI